MGNPWFVSSGGRRLRLHLNEWGEGLVIRWDVLRPCDGKCRRRHVRKYGWVPRYLLSPQVLVSGGGPFPDDAVWRCQHCGEYQASIRILEAPYRTTCAVRSNEFA